MRQYFSSEIRDRTENRVHSRQDLIDFFVDDEATLFCEVSVYWCRVAKHTLTPAREACVGKW
jgi:hypothetical protein